MDDETWMREALAEAEKSVGHTSPNPAVGAVVVRGGEIIGRGFHRRAGELHAEIEALRSLPDQSAALGSTLYVTLEPCSTHGRTPPCVDAIIAAGIAKVVFGATDPNPRHGGRGAELLRAAGIPAEGGILAAECAALSRAFNRWVVTGLPWVIAKAGLSLDGRLSRPPGESQWLTSEAARNRAMHLRAKVDAILIGAGTLRADNPHLTIRDVPGFAQKQPWRIVLTRREELPESAHVFTDEHRDRTLVFTDRSLPDVLLELGQREITSVLIEGGADILGQAFDTRIVDEVHFYVAPLLCGGPHVIGGLGAAATAKSLRLQEARYERLGDDLHVSGLVRTDGALDYADASGAAL